MIVIATLQAHEEHAHELEQALAHTVGPAQAEEGCLVYALHQVQGSPGRFVLVEGWASRSAYDAHMNSSHTAALVATLGKLLSAPPAIEVCEPLELGDPVKAIAST